MEFAHEAIAAIRARLWLLVLCTVALPIGALAYNAAEAKFEAKALMSFTPLNENQTLISLGIPTPSVPSGNQLLADEVLGQTIAQLDLFTSIDGLRKRLRVEQTQGSREAALIASAPTSAEAVRLVNAWATAFVESRNKLLANQFAAARFTIVERSEDRETTNAERRILRTRLAGLDAARAAARSDSEVSQSGVASAAPAGKVSEVVALIVGAIMGLALVLLLALLDRRIRTPALVSANYRLPLLATFPATPNRVDPLSPAVSVQSKLALSMNGSSPPRRIMVTSARSLPEEHMAAAHLARAYAESGQRTALVLWRAGDQANEDARRLSPSEAGARPTLVCDDGRWPVIRDRLDELSRTTDVVILDAPPILESGESLLASQGVDAWVMCAVVGVTSGDDADAFKREIAGLGNPPAGLVAFERAEGS